MCLLNDFGLGAIVALSLNSVDVFIVPFNEFTNGGSLSDQCLPRRSLSIDVHRVGKA